MCVESLTARGAISLQAKKHQLKIIFAEHNGKLYVKVIGAFSPEEFILTMLRDNGDREFSEISLRAEKAGFTDTNFSNLTKSLSNNGLILLVSSAGIGGATSKWKLTAKGKEYVQEKGY